MKCQHSWQSPGQAEHLLRIHVLMVTVSQRLISCGRRLRFASRMVPGFLAERAASGSAPPTR